MKIQKLFVFINIVFLFLFGTLSVTAQDQTFSWPSPNGHYTGMYKSRTYTRERLQNTYDLLEWGHLRMIDDPAVTAYSDNPGPHLAKLEEEYKLDVADLKAREIVNGPFWENLRKWRLGQLKRMFDLSRVTMLGYTNPKVLYEFAGVGACKTKYAASLIAGGDRLLRTWRSVNLRSRKINDDPEKMRAAFEQEYSSPDQQKFALIEVMSFGWWNCSVKSLGHVRNKPAIEREFRKLFVRVKTVRYRDEEPDGN